MRTILAGWIPIKSPVSRQNKTFEYSSLFWTIFYALSFFIFNFRQLEEVGDEGVPRILCMGIEGNNGLDRWDLSLQTGVLLSCRSARKSGVCFHFWVSSTMGDRRRWNVTYDLTLSASLEVHCNLATHHRPARRASDKIKHIPSMKT